MSRGRLPYERCGPHVAVVAAGAWAFGALGSACGADGTWLDVRLDADDELRGLGRAIALRVVREDGSEHVDRREIDAAFGWPTGVRLVPRTGTRSFRVESTLEADDGSPLAVVRATGRFREGERDTLVLRFDRTCAEECAPWTTCRAGRCADACVAVGEAGAVACDEVDAGMTDGAMALDGGMASDGGTASDGGMYAPSVRVARVVSHRSTASAPAIEAVPGTTVALEARVGGWLVFTSGALESGRPEARSAEASLLIDGEARARTTLAGGAAFSLFASVPSGEAVNVALGLSTAGFGGGGSATATDVVVGAVPLSLASTLASEESEGFRTLLAGAPTELERASWRSARGGRTLVLGLAQVSNTPSLEGVDVWLDVDGHVTPASTADGSHALEGRAELAAVTFVAPRDVSAGAHAAVMYASAGSPSSQAIASRLVVLDLESFARSAAAAVAGPAAVDATLATVSLPVDMPRDLVVFSAASLVGTTPVSLVVGGVAGGAARIAPLDVVASPFLTSRIDVVEAFVGGTPTLDATGSSAIEIRSATLVAISP